MLIFAQLFFAVGYAIFPFASYLTLKYIGHALPKEKVWEIYYVSTLMKYLPGSIWSLPGRVFLYQRVGVPAQKGTSSLFWELALMVSSGIFVSLLCVPLIAFYLPLPIVLSGFAAFFIGIGVLFWGLHSEGLYRSIERIGLLRPLVTVVAAPLNRLNLKQVFTITGIFLISWVILGVGFTLLIRAFQPDDLFFICWNILDSSQVHGSLALSLYFLQEVLEFVKDL